MLKQYYAIYFIKGIGYIDRFVYGSNKSEAKSRLDERAKDIHIYDYKTYQQKKEEFKEEYNL